MSTTTQSVLTISQLTEQIKGLLEGRFQGVIVQGEVTDFKQQASGHLYFTLKDANCQISAVLFKGNAANLTRIPKNGDQVMVKGEISVYGPRGNYQLLVRALKFSGVGELLLALEKRKQELKALGWFEQSIKKPLPKRPKTIGMVTSPTGAVIQDVLHVLQRRCPGFHLILNPVKVQGSGSAEEIASAINQFNRYKLADVLIVGRGGGSLEDLWSFNELVVAEAIHNSTIPIISAVGHETDFSIADFVADVRAPTPSAAAEIVSGAIGDDLTFLRETKKVLLSKTMTTVLHAKELLRGIKREPLLYQKGRLLLKFQQKIISVESALIPLNPKERLNNFRKRLQGVDSALKATLSHLFSKRKERLKRLVAHLQSLDPQNVLKKGYAIIFRQDSVILSSKELKDQEEIKIKMADGIINAKVKENYE